MAASAAQIAQLRRQVGEFGSATYSDVDLATYIEQYACVDEAGEKPYTLDTSTNPPTQDANEDWIATYDLNSAAADLWAEKAAGLTVNFDFTADGGTYHRSQAYEQAMKQSRYYLARRRPGVVVSHSYPQPLPLDGSRRSWIANAAEDD